MFNLKNALWLGDAGSLRAAAEMEARALAGALTARAPQEADAEALPRLYSRKGNVGVIEIRGPLVNSDSWMMEMLGMSTFPAIREALVFAASDPEVDQILLDIESPGGTVAGTNDTANLVRQVGVSKPVTAFSDGLIASAAYWVGSAAAKIYVGETAIVGSVGILATLVSESEALKKDGIEVRVVRAGKNKVLNHPAEPISERAVEKTQEQADAMYDVFTAAVMKNRPLLKADKMNAWAEGNVYLGLDSIEVGLADGVSTFDKVLAQLTVDKGEVDNYIPGHKKKRVVQMPRAALDTKLAALVESGAALSAEQQAEVDAVKAAAEAEAAQAQAAADAQAAAEAQAAADAEAAKIAAEAADAKAAAAKSEIVAYLEGQLKAATDALAATKTELATAQAELAGVKAPFDALVKIAADSVNTMIVALGGSKLESLSALPGKELVAKHAATRADFEKAFPTSAVAATTGVAKKPVVASVTPINAAGIAGVRNTIQGGK